MDGSYASAELLAQVVSSKYLDHLPLYRLNNIALRDGVSLPRSTLSDWIGRIGVALDPLYEAIKTLLLKESLLHVDETPVDQLTPKAPGKNHRSYMWVYRNRLAMTGQQGDAPRSSWVVFDYQTSRAGEHPRAFLADYSGHLMVDDYAGYKALFNRDDNPLIELGCWAHIRRKFSEINDPNPSGLANQVIALIALLYQIDSQADGENDAQRQALRQQYARPVLDQLYTLLTTGSTGVAKGSDVDKAIKHTLKRWETLVRYVDLGSLPIDNNPAENAIRPIALGRKNWLFIGSESAGKRQKSIFSLLASAIANNLNPAHWLSDTLKRLPTTKNKDLHLLLPGRDWKPLPET
jgi:hypothetical protein